MKILARTKTIVQLKVDIKKKNQSNKIFISLKENFNSLIKRN